MGDKILKYPQSKDFIFTIFDDTDVATLGNIEPIYNFLCENGFKTTKTVWPCSFNGQSDYTGSHTLEHAQYAQYIKKLYDHGFEIAYHGASMASSSREKIERSFKVFNELLGIYPRTYAAHASNKDNFYWGENRFSSPAIKWLYNRLYKENAGHYEGHIHGSSFYWEDLAQAHIQYSRNLTYNAINLLKISDILVYKDKNKPLVNNYFITSDAENVEEFNALICEKNQSKLEKQRGICIISTHFGKGFVDNGKLHPKTRALLESISRKKGWFVPVGQVLDFLISQTQSEQFISKKKLFHLEFQWFLHSCARRFKKHNYKRTETPYLLESIHDEQLKEKTPYDMSNIHS